MQAVLYKKKQNLYNHKETKKKSIITLTRKEIRKKNNHLNI